MFKKNTIGEKINEILVKHGKENLYNCSFEEAVKNSSYILKTMMDFPIKDRISDVYNPYSGDYELAEDWISCLLFHMYYNEQDNEPLKKFDAYVYWFVNHAIYYYDERIWRKYFTIIHTGNNYIAYRNEEKLKKQFKS